MPRYETGSVIIKNLFIGPEVLEFFWDRGSCEVTSTKEHGEIFVKDTEKLRALGWTADEVYFVGDKPYSLHLRGNFGNFIHVQPYFGSHGDRELNNVLAIFQATL